MEQRNRFPQKGKRGTRLQDKGPNYIIEKVRTSFINALRFILGPREDP